MAALCEAAGGREASGGRSKRRLGVVVGATAAAALVAGCGVRAESSA
jgi:hypothetical protein